MPIYRGYKSAITFGLQSAFKTVVARNNALHIERCTLQERPVYEALPTLWQSGKTARGDTVKLQIPATGQLVMPMLYEGFGFILANAMGGAPTTTGSGPYTHVWELGTTFPGLSLENLRGSSGKSEIFVGTLFPRWRQRIEAKKLVNFSADCLAYKASAARDTAATPTFGRTVQAGGMMGHHVVATDVAGEFAFNSANYAFQWMELDVDLHLEGTQETGSYYAINPEPAEQTDVLIRVGLLQRDEALYTAYLAKTSSNLDVDLDGPGNYAYQILGRNCEIVDYNDEIGGTGRVQATATFRAMPDATNNALKLTLVNDQATYSTN